MIMINDNGNYNDEKTISGYAPSDKWPLNTPYITRNTYTPSWVHDVGLVYIACYQAKLLEYLIGAWLLPFGAG